jgi:hypothetical protein
MNQPVIEPVRDHFFRPTPVAEEPASADDKFYPLSDKRFGAYGVSWSPRELSGDELHRTIEDTKERLALYIVNGNSKQKTEERLILDACLQEIQRRKLAPKL